MNIHPTGIIESGAQVADNVTIGPFTFIGKHVTIDSGTVIQHHASVDGYTILGENNVIFPYACLRGQTQDLKYVGDLTGLCCKSVIATMKILPRFRVEIISISKRVSALSAIVR
jgi:acyl-[acyl carrier protein]--UDP-N-acetylglucosamine O-acyltransferase